MKQAYLLRSLSKDKHLEVPDVLKDPHIAVYQRAKKTFYHWEKDILGQTSVKTSKDIREMQDKVILASSSYDMNEVLDIQPGPGGASSTAAQSRSMRRWRLNMNGSSTG